MLGHMREIKLLGLTDRLTLVIQRLREIEVSKSQNFRQFVVWNITFCELFSPRSNWWLLILDIQPRSLL